MTTTGLEDHTLDDTPASDFLGFELLLDDEDRKLLDRVREYMTTHVEPVINGRNGRLVQPAVAASWK